MSWFLSIGEALGNYMDDMGEALLSPEQMHEARSREQHPYSYSPILQYDSGIKGNGTVYSDRLLQWDHEKHDAACLAVFGDKRQFWSNRPAPMVQEFLRQYLDKPELKLARIVEYCNQANGYPCWRFDYLDNKEDNA